MSLMQFLGALLGAWAAGVAWGPLTTGVQYAVTVPGDGYSQAGALAAETLITFLLVFTIFVCVNKPKHRAARPDSLPAPSSRSWS